MDEPDQAANKDAPAEHFTAHEGLEQQLRERLAEVVRILVLADEEGKRVGPAAFRLVDRYHDRFADAMVNFGEALADVLAMADSPTTLLRQPAFAELLKPFLNYVRTVLVFRRLQEWDQRHLERDELENAALLANQPAFVLSTKLLGDFYTGSTLARSYRMRTAVLAEWVHAEARSHSATTERETVKLLKLSCGNRLELEPLLVDAKCAATLLITFVDNDIAALRRMRQLTQKKLAHKARFLRADPLTLGLSPTSPRGGFDIVYTVDLLTTLTVQQIADVLHSSYTFLNPGGVLFTGGFLPNVPRSEKALLSGLFGIQVQYMDEMDWRRLLAAARFDLDNTRFEQLAPSTILVAARRGEPAESMQ